MLSDPHVLIAIESSGVSVVAIEAVGDDPLRAVGAVLLWLSDVLRQFDPATPRVFTWRLPKKSVSRTTAHHFIAISKHTNRSVGDLRAEGRAILDELVRRWRQR